MPRPPLANLLAFHSRDEGVLKAATDRLRKSGEFDSLWQPAPGWIVGASPLPGDDSHGNYGQRPIPELAFAEGREAVSAGAAPTNADFWTTLRETACAQPERLRNYPGDFGFIAFGADGDATITRSCGGLAPFYVSRKPGWACISTRMKWLIRFAPSEFGFDPLVNALWAAGWTWFPERRTFFQDVSILERGGWARVSEGALQFGRYWTPRPDQPPRFDADRAREHPQRLRALLIARLERDLDPAGGNLLALSGGVDSSALGALATRRGRKVTSFTTLPVKEESYQREMSFIRPLAQECGFEGAWGLPLPRLDYLALLRSAPAVEFQISHPVLCALPQLVSKTPVTTLFGGEMADMLCGSVATMPDLIDTLSLSETVRHLGELHVGPRFLGAWLKHRWRDLRGRLPSAMPFPSQLPGWTCPELRDELDELRDRRRRQALRERCAWRQLGMLLEVDGWTAMSWEATSELGLRRSIPFNCREIIELTLECHPLELIGKDTKLLLRNALKQDVPARNLYRRDKGGWGRRDPIPDAVPWNEKLSARLRGVVRDDWLPRPPASLDYETAKMLTRLAVFDGNHLGG